MLAKALGYLPIYVRYNSGLSIVQNGHALARQLEQLATHWPGGLGEISVLAYSMGGLVIRSACHSADLAAHAWPAHLKTCYFSAHPIMAHRSNPPATGWSNCCRRRPTASPSSGWHSCAASASGSAPRQGDGLISNPESPLLPLGRSSRPLSLPGGVRCFAIAATTAAKRSVLADRLIGDGLVPLRSALGLHDEARHQLAFLPPIP